MAKIEVDVNLLNVLLSNANSEKELIEFVKGIDDAIASWEFSLALLKHLIERDLEYINELGRGEKDDVESIYPQLKKFTKKLKKYLESCEGF